MRPCIVIGGDHHNTLGVIRSLGKQGIKPDVIICPSSGRSYVSKSKYVNKYIHLKSADMVTSYLIKSYQGCEERPIIISCSDVVAAVIDDSLDKLKKHFIVPCSVHGQGYLNRVMDKANMQQLAIDSGLPVPATWSTIDSVKYPCFIKPLVSKDGAKSDIAICKNANELQTYLMSDHISSNFQIQEYIYKDFEFQLIGLSLDGGKIVIIPGISKIIRSSETSNTGYLSYVPCEDMDFRYWEQCKSFIKNIGFSGLFSIEFLRDNKGYDCFMEINLRNDGNSICVTHAGVNLPFIWYSFNIGKDIGDINKYRIKHPIKVLPEFDDLFLLKRKNISVREWLKSIITADGYMEFDRHDPMPFFYRFWQLISHRY